MPSAASRAAVSDRVFQALCQDVLSGRYEPGEKLPTQRALAAELGVNMASIREAVKRLEQLRLVEVRQGDAMRVTDWRAHGGLDVIAHVLFAAGGLERGTLASLMEARQVMLAEAAALAAARRDDEAAERLTELAERIATAPDAAAQAIDFAFFAELVDAADNVVFALVMNSIRQIYFERAELFAAVVADAGELAPLYRAVARAVATANAGAARNATSDLAAEQERQLMRSLP